MRKVLYVILGIVVVLLVAAWLKLRGPEIPFADLEAKYAGTGSAFVDLAPDFRVHYQASGVPGSPVVVLLHGYGDAFTAWEHWAPVLAADYRVIALDLPGHGLTRAPEGYALSGEGLADVLERVTRALGLKSFALAGNSMGGGVAWNYALLHPERLTALVLVDAAGWPHAPTGDAPLAFRILKYPIGRWFLAHIDNRPLIESGLKGDVYDPGVITPAYVDRWAEFQRAPGHRATLMSIAPGGFGTATAQRLAALRVPTLVLHGEDDHMIPLADGRAFAAAIPGATLITYPHVGHLPQVEVPERSAHDVAAFLAQHPPAP